MGYGAASSLVVGYPLIIVGSGLWFRVRFVWFMTLLSLLSYGVLVVDFYCWRPELQRRQITPGSTATSSLPSRWWCSARSCRIWSQRVRVLSSFYGRPV